MVYSQQPEIRVLVLSPVRIYREGLSRVLAEEYGIRIVGLGSRIEDAASILGDEFTDVVLFDISIEGGLLALRQLNRYGAPRVLVIGIQRDEEIIACAEAGIAGYVTPDHSLVGLVSTIRDAARGEFNCPPHIASGLLRRLAVLATFGQEASSRPRLTLREREIVKLIGEGLSNKEIARRLSIQLATVKNHIHNVLKKSGVSRRMDAVAVLCDYQALGDPAEVTPSPTGSRSRSSSEPNSVLDRI
jgi:two-component system, NarL family, nitrate/nitrite response regulator NarL